MKSEKYSKILKHFKNPKSKFYKLEKVFLKSAVEPVPKEPGIYAFYFSEEITKMTYGCELEYGDYTLLYLGIAPTKYSSSSNIRKRIRQHYTGNIQGSTLRKTLACLINEEKPLQFRDPQEKRPKLKDNSRKELNRWITEYSRITWYPVEKPWSYESRLILELKPPLNLECNGGHPFYETLQSLRVNFFKDKKQAKEA